MSNNSRLQAHLDFVYHNSPFYQAYWQQAWQNTGGAPRLADLPVIEHRAFWQANGLEQNQVLTGDFTAGVVFKSGGTTGNPKFSYFSNEDWKGFCAVFGSALLKGGIKPGERIANLFYGGQLYASLLFIGRSIEEAGVGINFPISGAAPVDEIVKTLQQFKIDTLAGVPTTIINLLPALSQCDEVRLNIKRCIYGGEPMYSDQIAALQQVLPNCRVQSIGIAGVDYGEMGFVDPDCEPGVHRVLDDSTLLELLDDEGQPIEQVGEPGRIVITNLKRKLMPIVRYPVGDRAQWVDEAGVEGRRYRLLGRADEGARIGPMTLYLDDVRSLLDQAPPNVNILSFQLRIEHLQQMDRCTLRLAVAEPETMSVTDSEQLISMLFKQRPMFPDLIAQSIVHPLSIEWITPAQLLHNPRTGKLMQVIDRRHEANH